MMKHRGAAVLGLILTMSISWSSAARVRGGSDVGGGKALVCRNDDHSIKSVELLDLWEARVIDHKLPIPILGKPIDNVDRMVHELRNINLFDNDNAALWLHEETGYILLGGNVNWISGAALALTSDSFELIQPIEDSQCHVEQVVDYTDLPGGPQILINKDIYDAMDATNQLALALHESIYHYLRMDSGELSSRRTRRVVAKVIVGTQFKSLAEFYKRPYIECSQENLSPKGFYQTFFDFVQMDWGANSQIVVPIVSRISTRQGDLGLMNFMMHQCGGSSCHDLNAFYRDLLNKGYIQPIWLSADQYPDPEEETNGVIKIGPHAIGTITIIDTPDHKSFDPSAVKCVLRPGR